MSKICTDDFLSMAQQYPVLDVRSPGEYFHAHVPGAYNLPLFSDEERKVVGTAYKQEGREVAIKIGLDYFGVKMRKMVEEVEQIVQNHKIKNNPNSQLQIPGSNKNTVLLHCWRGGMRSAGVAWLLGLYGFKVYTLNDGYKAFRNWVLQQLAKPYPLKVVGGYTGSGKTEVLNELAKAGHTIIDMEGLAHHKGSAFGDLGNPKQPTTEMFENELALALGATHKSETIWIEDESQRIGNINIHNVFWKTMRSAPVFFLEVPFEERLKHITEEYGKFEKEKLVDAVGRIQRRLGGLDAKNATKYLLENNFTEAFRILLSYYDKYYKKGLDARTRHDSMRAMITFVTCHAFDVRSNSEDLLSAYHTFILNSEKEQGN